MMTWASIILGLLKLANLILGAINRDKWIKAGEDAEIAKTSAALLAKTEYARKVRERVNAMDDNALDRALRDLEPK